MTRPGDCNICGTGLPQHDSRCPKVTGFPKYQHQPTTVEALQWTGYNRTEMIEFFGGVNNGVVPDVESMPLMIHTLEGPMFAKVDWWVVKGEADEFWCVEPSRFAATYEAIASIQHA